MQLSRVVEALTADLSTEEADLEDIFLALTQENAATAQHLGEHDREAETVSLFRSKPMP